MVEISETDLPGVGRKFTLEGTESGDRVVVIVHHGGRREVYHFVGDAEEPADILSLSDEEARKVAAILSGAYFQPQVGEKLEVLLHDLVIEWYDLSGDLVGLVGASLEEADVRRRTGVSVLAVLRDDETLANPPGDLVLKEGDVLVAVGTRAQHADLEPLMRGEG